MGPTCVVTMFASSFAKRPMRQGQNTWKKLEYVNNTNNFILLPSFVFSYYIDLFFKLDLSDAGQSSTNRARTSNSRGNLWIPR